MITAGLAGLIAWRGLGLLALGLAGDFALRARGQTRLSPVAILALGLRRGMRVPARLVNAGPKRFAATLGALLSLGAATGLLSAHRVLGSGLAGALATCAGLEGVFGFCLACRVHAWFPQVRPRPAPETIGLS